MAITCSRCGAPLPAEAGGDPSRAAACPHCDGPPPATDAPGVTPPPSPAEESLVAEPPGPDEEAPQRLDELPPPVSPVPVPVQDLSALLSYVPVEVAPAAPLHGTQDGGPFAFRLRLVQCLSGVVLLTVFLLPWNGARSWELLRYLGGLDFARQMALLVAGSVLLSSGLLPVPPLFRSALGTAVSVLALSLGGLLLDPWQTLLALLVSTLLPATLFLRTEMRLARVPRLLGLMALLGLVALYLLPRDRVPPLRVAFDLVYQREDMARFIGTYLLLPLPLLCLAAVALVGQDVAVIGELLGWLFLCWGPGALLVLAIDPTQTYVAATLLCYGASAAYGLADLLRRVMVTETA